MRFKKLMSIFLADKKCTPKGVGRPLFNWRTWLFRQAFNMKSKTERAGQ